MLLLWFQKNEVMNSLPIALREELAYIVNAGTFAQVCMIQLIVVFIHSKMHNTVIFLNMNGHEGYAGWDTFPDSKQMELNRWIVCLFEALLQPRGWTAGSIPELSFAISWAEDYIHSRGTRQTAHTYIFLSHQLILSGSIAIASMEHVLSNSTLDVVPVRTQMCIITLQCTYPLGLIS